MPPGIPLRPPNAIYWATRKAGGPTALCRILEISERTLQRWRAAGAVSDGQAIFRWVAFLHPDDPAAQVRLGRQLAGLDPMPRRRVDHGARRRHRVTHAST